MNYNTALYFYNNLLTDIIIESLDINNIAYKNYNENIEYITEGPLLTGLVGLGVATTIFGKDNIIDFFKNMINLCIKMITFLIESMKKIWKWISINSKDVQASNSKFLERYGFKLAKMNHMSITDEGYEITKDIMALLNTFTVEYRNSSNDVSYITDILNGESAFISREDMLHALARNRSDILDIDKIGSDKNYGAVIKTDAEFKQYLRDKLYGVKHLVSYSINDCLNIIKNYDNRIDLIEATRKNIEIQGKQDIANLNKLLNSFINGKAIVPELKENAIKQFKFLIEFKQTLLQDFLIAFNEIYLYINEINTQSKAICIKALMQS